MLQQQMQYTASSLNEPSHHIKGAYQQHIRDSVSSDRNLELSKMEGDETEQKNQSKRKRKRRKIKNELVRLIPKWTMVI